MNSAFHKFIQEPTEGFLPLYASFKNILMNGFLRTNLHDTNKFQIIYLNNRYLKGKFLYNYLNTLLYRAVILENQLASVLGPTKCFIYVVHIYCSPEEGSIFFRNENIGSCFKGIADIVYCLGLLVKNSLVIFNSLDIFKINQTFNIYSETRYFENLCPNVLGNYPYNCTENNNSLVFSKQYQKCISTPERLKNLNFSCFDDASSSFAVFLNAINTSFQNWFKYEIAASFFCFSRELMKRGDISSECKNLDLSFDNHVDIQYNTNNTIDYEVDGGNIIRTSIKDSQSSVLQHEVILHSVQTLRMNELNEKAEYVCFNEKLASIFNVLSQINFFSGLYPNLHHMVEKNTAILCNTSAFLKYPLQALLSSNITENRIQSKFYLKEDVSAKKKIYHGNFIVTERNIHIPKGSSPVTWIDNNSSRTFFRRFKNNEIMKYGHKQFCLEANDASLLLTNDYPKELAQKRILRSVSKNFFNAINVIGQVDKKFVLCEYIEDQCTTLEQHLIILDQHAVDERIQLEKLLSRFRVSFEDGNFRTHLITGELITFELGKDDMNTVLQFSDYFLRYGLHLKQTSCNKLAVTAIPEFLHWLASRRTNDNAGYNSFVETTINTMILEQLTSVRGTGYITNIMPSVLYKYVCREACLCALNFGRPLSSNNCEEIIKELACCVLPFMCAHGRPVVCFLGKLPSFSRSVHPPTITSLRKGHDKIH